MEHVKMSADANVFRRMLDTLGGEASAPVSVDTREDGEESKEQKRDGEKTATKKKKAKQKATPLASIFRTRRREAAVRRRTNKANAPAAAAAAASAAVNAPAASAEAEEVSSGTEERVRAAELKAAAMARPRTRARKRPKSATPKRAAARTRVKATATPVRVPVPLVASVQPAPVRLAIPAPDGKSEARTIEIKPIEDLIAARPGLLSASGPAPPLDPAFIAKKMGITRTAARSVVPGAHESEGKYDRPRAASSATSIDDDLLLGTLSISDPARDRESPLHVPKIHDYILKAMEKLVRPLPTLMTREHEGGTRAATDTEGETDIRRLIAEGRVDVPFISAAHESELLGASGKHVHPNGKTYTFPACTAAEKCVGMTEYIRAERPAPGAPVPVAREYMVIGKNALVPTGPTGTTTEGKGMPSVRRVLTQFMWPDQYERFLADGVAPAQKMYCVLCNRRNVSAVVAAALGAESMVMPVNGEFINLYQVHRGEDGGYVDACLNNGHGLRMQPLRGCFPMFRRSYLFWVNVKGRWMVDQSQMIARPPSPLAVTIGESLRSF